jgi:hypothetical protein
VEAVSASEGLPPQSLRAPVIARPVAPRRRPTRQIAVMSPQQYASKVTLTGGVFTGTDENANVYLDLPIRSGKHYWEVVLRCGPIMTGVTNDVENPRHWGGFSESNAGIYTWRPSVWPDPPNGAGSDPWRRSNLRSRDDHNGFGTPRSGAVFGFALDADARTLRTFWDGEEGPTLRLAFRGPYYPHAAVQMGFRIPSGQPCEGTPGSGEFRFRKGATKHPPPRGYRLLMN